MDEALRANWGPVNRQPPSSSGLDSSLGNVDCLSVCCSLREDYEAHSRTLKDRFIGRWVNNSGERQKYCAYGFSCRNLTDQTG